MLAAVITLSVLLIAVVAFAVFAVRDAQQVGNIWEARWSKLRDQLDDKTTKYVELVRDLEEAHTRAVDSAEKYHQEFAKCANADREMCNDAIDLFMELHPDLADNFGDWSEDRHGQRDRLRGADYEKVREYREQEELSDKFSSYVKAKRDASGKVASDARDS